MLIIYTTCFRLRAEQLDPIETFSGALSAITLGFRLGDDAGHLTGAGAHLVDGEALALQVP